jgi:hypothetical protein
MSPSPTDLFRIEAVFDALVDLSPDEQMAYLDRTASDDPELREEVFRQLEAHRHGSHRSRTAVAPMNGPDAIPVP